MMQKCATIIRASFFIVRLLFAISTLKIINVNASVQKISVTNASGGQHVVICDKLCFQGGDPLQVG